MVSKALEYSPEDPHHATVFADLDPKLRGLLLGIPAGALGKGKIARDDVPSAEGWTEREEERD